MKKQNKSIKIDTRVTETHYNSLKETALTQDTTVSTLIRDILFKGNTSQIDLQKSYLINVIRLSGVRSNAKKELLKEILRDEISYNKKI